MSCVPVSPEVAARADLLIHIGAGGCPELPAYIESGKRVLLLEAHPQAARELARRASHAPHIKVLSCAVAAQSGEQVLRLHSLGRFASFRNPTGLLDLYPGLKVVDTVPVECRTPTELFDTEEFEANNICVVIAMTGEELSVLQAFRESGLLKHIRDIVLRCGQKVLFEGAGSASEIAQYLEREGFEKTAETSDDPDLPVQEFRLNQWRVKYSDLARGYKLLQAKVQQAEQRHAAEIEQLRDRHSEELAAAEQRQREALERTRSDLAHANNDKTRFEHLKQELTAQQEALAAREAALEKAQEHITDLQKDLETLTSQREQVRLRSEEAVRALNTQHQDEVDALKAENAGLKEELKSFQAKYKEVEAQLRAAKEKEAELEYLQKENEELQRQQKEQSRALMEKEDCIRVLEAELEHSRATEPALHQKFHTAHEQHVEELENLRQEHAAELSRTVNQKNEVLRKLAVATEELRRIKEQRERDDTREKLDGVQAERDELAKALEAKAAELKSQHLELEQARKEVESSSRELAGLEQQLSQVQQKLKSQLEQKAGELAQLEARNKLLQEEIARAEGQVDVIKSLFLGEGHG